MTDWRGMPQEYRNRIVTGEASAMLATLPDDCIDLTVTSPPYDNLRQYNGYTFEFEPIARELWRVTKPGGVVVWVVADATIKGSETFTSLRQALYFRDVCGFNAHDTMIYNTDKPPLTHNRYDPCFEYMFVFSKGKPSTFNPLMVKTKTGGRKRTGTYYECNGEKREQHKIGHVGNARIKTSLWYYPNGEQKSIIDHPAIFPEALARDHIISWSNPDDIILDPMAGSGTTAKMAKLTGRRWLGFDISAEYVELANRRVDKAEIIPEQLELSL